MRRLSVRYPDATTIWLPLGIAFVPSHDVAYHSGGLYEVIIGMVVFAIVWPLRHRLRRPTMAVWVVIALLAAGSFVEFFILALMLSVAAGLVH